VGIIHNISYAETTSNHGGTRRSQQLGEIVQSRFGIVPSFPSTTGLRELSRAQQASLMLLGFSKTLPLRDSRTADPKKLIRAGYISSSLREKMSEVDKPHVLLWEGTSGSNLATRALAQKLKMKIIAIPQNVESLVRPNYAEQPAKKQTRHLVREIKELQACSAVFTISKEEQWLLQNLGVNAYYLPYYPTKQEFLRLLHTRKLRLQTAKNKFVILGTASNSPTRSGMVQLLSLLKWRGTEANSNIVIAGYGTESLISIAQEIGVTVIGGVSTEKLNDLLYSAKALLVHQSTGSGALTRIVEALISGIPVVASHHAARDYHGVAGVSVYHNSQGLDELLKTELPMPPVPPKPEEREEEFLNEISKILSQ